MLDILKLHIIQSSITNLGEKDVNSTNCCFGGNCSFYDMCLNYLKS